ncbi:MULTISPECIES: hypothetical protein [unclassified Mesorhizobium]|uniref:hypothetical protein n=1 Tax=unclassified Mesorhizobium TaxID=325217 RepID=UPI00112A0C0A|nr:MULTISPECIES: hypothetical protein [unclassified Mesorhizobium]MBZ9894642.1 hypothetical protein [Mesorhizobium sp. BR1-1-6]MBZ9982511.1 hypothetical protein [Mesorhizobium sp. BR-1-1-8]TPL32235.1 hypothetical protein FJ947_22395 [Mesorhizobium sp. B2-4-8]TPL61186.1 hypothetical protein FJ949_23965 [Mesorhizobium sp. B2-4-1]TPM98651.1 hypothetical protein FJ966_11490 [Mesorhizobium sp. B2-1-5]
MDRLSKSTEAIIQKAIEESLEGDIVSLKKTVGLIRAKRPDLKEELDEMETDNELCEQVVQLASAIGKVVLFDLHE